MFSKNILLALALLKGVSQGSKFGQTFFKSCYSRRDRGTVRPFVKARVIPRGKVDLELFEEQLI
jgi:hypothetical protein